MKLNQVLPVGSNAIRRARIGDRKREILLEAVGLLFIGCANRLLYVEDHAIRVHGTHFDIPIEICDFNNGPGRDGRFFVLVECEVISGDVP